MVNSIGIDASYVVKGFAEQGAKRMQLRQGQNGDIWDRNGEVQDAWPELEIRKTKGRPTFADFGTSVGQKCKFLGVVLADVAANIAADGARLPQHIDQQIRSAESATFCFCLRLASIEAQLWEAKPADVEPPPVPAPKPELTRNEAADWLCEIASVRGHQLENRGDKWQVCTRCRQRRLRGSPLWATVTCGSKLPSEGKRSAASAFNSVIATVRRKQSCSHPRRSGSKRGGANGQCNSCCGVIGF